MVCMVHAWQACMVPWSMVVRHVWWGMAHAWCVCMVHMVGISQHFRLAKPYMYGCTNHPLMATGQAGGLGRGGALRSRHHGRVTV